MIFWLAPGFLEVLDRQPRLRDLGGCDSVAVANTQQSRAVAGTEITRPQYQREGLRYANDTTDEEWTIIAPHLPAPASCGRRRKHALREIGNAIFYVAQTGCQWRQLPSEFPPYTTVQRYYYAADEREFIGEGYVDVAMGVFGQLREFRGAGAGDAALAPNDDFVEREDALGAFADHAADHPGLLTTSSRIRPAAPVRGSEPPEPRPSRRVAGGR
jgi:hypothetical protein